MLENLKTIVSLLKVIVPRDDIIDAVMAVMPKAYGRKKKTVTTNITKLFDRHFRIKTSDIKE